MFFMKFVIKMRLTDNLSYVLNHYVLFKQTNQIFYEKRPIFNNVNYFLRNCVCADKFVENNNKKNE